jgi:DNA-binding NarL/FixJ family response regulator
MDVRMPELDGLEATRTIKAAQPEVGVLVVTTYENPDYLLEALKAGAAGYLLKDAPKKQLLNAVRRVLNGESPLNQELAAQLIQRLVSEVAQPTQQPTQPTPARGHGSSGTARPPEDLTRRELEVLRLVAQGKTNQEIAGVLVISAGTAKVHVQNLIRKLGVSDRTQAAVRAVELGMLTT